MMEDLEKKYEKESFKQRLLIAVLVLVVAGLILSAIIFFM